jgi:hypothetical protein
VPSILQALVADADRARAQRAFAAMLKMKKPDTAARKQAHAG